MDIWRAQTPHISLFTLYDTMNTSRNSPVSDMITTRIHLDKQFEIESHQYALKTLKVDVIMSNTPISRGKNLLDTLRINSVFLYYLAYVMVGFALTGLT